ncbi:MAG: CDP-glycerol glycerophosphotransferase family protein, partial [Clostridia bacterium]|nr:CDP-glycerol glycerophosphotransferase family protein [Clostridia bacterium]
MNIVNMVKRLRHKFLIKMYSSIPIKKNKIIIWSNSFKSYGCNPKYIAEYILENYPGEFDIVWVIDADLPVPSDIPEGVRIVRYFSKQYLYELHTARFVVCNARTSDAYFWHKRKNQIYIQTWHSSIRLKTIEKDAENSLPERYIEAAKSDSKKIDYIISGCDFSSRIFKESFWYDG